VRADSACVSSVCVVGPSGAGKSSLVRAAVAPRVAGGALGPGPWRVATLVPGRHPTAALAQAIGPARDAKLLVVVDQLEEVWTLADVSERRAFAEALAGLARAGPARVVATLRADFLSRLDGLGELRGFALRASVVLG